MSKNGKSKSKKHELLVEVPDDVKVVGVSFFSDDTDELIGAINVLASDMVSSPIFTTAMVELTLGTVPGYPKVGVIMSSPIETPKKKKDFKELKKLLKAGADIIEAGVMRSQKAMLEAAAAQAVDKMMRAQKGEPQESEDTCDDPNCVCKAMPGSPGAEVVVLPVDQDGPSPYI